ncbi:Vgb family protein [Thermomonospora amylolytica]|uniref:Vgb family protein n=1 Tax=Thermomonospora amylolytica TaxID=1411117 RepID=UPI00130061E1|nr:hypothetical protein [Thermomonospora amylolytica]
MFHVHPRPQTAPLSVAAGKTSPLKPIDELVGTDASTGLDTMFIRVVKTGTGCAPTGAPDPGITLQADTGDPVEVPRLPDSASIFNGPGGTGAEVANATLQAEPDDIYLIRIFIFTRGSQWKIQLVNHDQTAAHAFTWTVADNDAETRQPWIDAPADFAFTVESGQTDTRHTRIANLGTGTLTIEDKEGTQPGPGFTLTAIPKEIGPNACGDLVVTFTGPDAPGVSSADHTFTCNDTTAQPTAGHNRQITLTATTTRRHRLPPGTIVIADANAAGPDETGFVTGGVFRVDPATGKQAKVSFGGLIGSPHAVAVESDGMILVADIRADRIVRVDPETGEQAVLTGGRPLDGVHGLAVEADGRILAVYNGGGSGAGGVIRVDPVTGTQTVLVTVGRGGGARDIALESGGRVLVVKRLRQLSQLIRVDLRTGSQTVLVSFVRDVTPTGVAVESGGGILITDAARFTGTGGVIRVDPVTGAQTTLSHGGLLKAPTGIALTTGGHILVADKRAFGNSGGIIRVDPSDGTQSKVSSGDLFRGGELTIAVVPEAEGGG